MQSLLTIAVGNSRTRFGIFKDNDLSDPTSLPNADLPALQTAIIQALESHHNIPIAMSSVNATVADALESALEDAGEKVFRINRDIAVPMKHALDDNKTLGQDRILCAFGAFKRAGQAVVIIDAGTAITVDFVDGEGTFQGGAIAPGVALMLRAMHEHTAALPAVEPAAPDAARGAFGKDTTHAMLLGARAAAIGMAHHLIDTYAGEYGAYPQIVATGGDAVMLFENDEIVEHIIPDLQLIGLFEAVKAVREE